AEVEVALLRPAQSALATVSQHSQASRVMVSLMDLDGSIRMDIVDDGIGMADAGARQRDSESGFGLDFIGSRMRELGGELVVESTPGSGFAISATVPDNPTLRPRREPTGGNTAGGDTPKGTLGEADASNGQDTQGDSA
ncbi:MAG: hypothetical protein L0J03_15710, partial [Brevibacterium sp.]|nr:hypothetical protein [Brevibacterium sp.]